MSFVTHLECSVCGKQYPAGVLHNLCECGGPLLVRYDLERARAEWSREELEQGPADMWRYAPMLPVTDEQHIVSMGEGWTPLIRTRRLGKRIGAEDLWVKDEGLNPTGSFKARGLACAISMCSMLGVRRRRSRLQAMPPARWRRMRPQPESRRISSCLVTCRTRTSLSARLRGRM